jgi:hypothetical protein
MLLEVLLELAPHENMAWTSKLNFDRPPAIFHRNLGHKRDAHTVILLVLVRLLVGAHHTRHESDSVVRTDLVNIEIQQHFCRSPRISYKRFEILFMHYVEFLLKR